MRVLYLPSALHEDANRIAASTREEPDLCLRRLVALLEAASAAAASSSLLTVTYAWEATRDAALEAVRRGESEWYAVAVRHLLAVEAMAATGAAFGLPLERGRHTATMVGFAVLRRLCAGR